MKSGVALVLVCLGGSGGMGRALAQGVGGGWATSPPERLPRVGVRWEDPTQRETFVVEGARYQARVATQPARILSLRVDGAELLGDGGLRLGLADEAGQAYQACPAGLRPEWNVWRREWVPATDSLARMNVWSATPYYWDAHLLDIPMVTTGYAERLAAPAGPPLVAWDFARDAAGWAAANDCEASVTPGAWRVTSTGNDPFLVGPPVEVPGPLRLVIRMRCEQGGGAAFYWGEGDQPELSGERVVLFGIQGDGQWHEYVVELPLKAPLRRLRLDPPGGTTDVAWIRAEALPEPDPTLAPPIRGEMVLHAHPDELRLEFRADPNPGQARPARAVFTVGGGPREVTLLGGRPLARLGEGDRAAWILGPEGGTLDGAEAWTAPLVGERPGAVWILRPAEAGVTPEEAFAEELDPLAADQVEVRDGYWLGYDHAAGLYRVQSALHHPAYGFEANYVNPLRRVTNGITLRNTDRARRMTVKWMTGVGNLEAAVLTDPYGFPLPTPAFVAKNFAGELEEPDDSAFGDSYFPLTLEPSEERSFGIVHANTHWGNHLLKQVSSIRFFHIYWHLSTGASETTCFTHDWMEIGSGETFMIPDFRPMSGPIWPGQPQHDCQQFPGFLQYNGRKARLVYERTDFASVSPCLARFTNHYHTSDNAATATVSVMEIPQRDEMRTFAKVRYDWTQPVTIEGDARLGFRWFNLYEFNTPRALLYTDAAGATREVPTAAGEPMLLGEPLTPDSPFVASDPIGDRYGCVVLVRSFRARLGGQEYSQPAVSAQFGPANGCWWLTVPAETLSLRPGDFVEAEVMLMPHGEPSLPTLKPERERTERFGLGLPRVLDVSVGEKLSDFPATVRADDEVASFSLEGGFDAMPLVVEGFRGWGVPLLWREGVWQDQQAAGGDGYEVEADGQGGYRFTFVYPIRRGQTLPFVVTRAECSTGISRLTDRNGYPVLEASTPGRFHLKAPMLFGPGRNRVTPGAPVVEFEGEGGSVRGLPVSVESPGPTEVELDATGLSATVRGGPAGLTFHELHWGGRYAVEVDGEAREVVATDGRVRIELPAAGGHVALAPK